MKFVRKILVLSTLAASLAGCATQQGQQEQGGMIVGGLLGGVLGSQVGQGSGRTVATIVGTMIGATVGGNVGRSMDQTEKLKTAHALENVCASVPTSWVNPDSRNQYTVTPTRTCDARTSPCRGYTVRSVVAGKPEAVYGTACRQADGSWKTTS